MKKRIERKYLLCRTGFLAGVFLLSAAACLAFCLINALLKTKLIGTLVLFILVIGLLYILTGEAFTDDFSDDSPSQLFAIGLKKAPFAGITVGALVQLLRVFGLFPALFLPAFFFPVLIIISGAAGLLLCLKELQAMPAVAERACDNEVFPHCGYPEDRIILVRVAREHPSTKMRRLALEQLPYPEEKEILLYAAENDRDKDNRCLAVEKLPYPLESRTLAEIARESEFVEVRRCALQKLSYPSERETFCHIALHDEDVRCRENAFRKLSPDADRDTIRQIALQEDNFAIRLKALQERSLPQDRDVFREAALKDDFSENRKYALSVLRIEEDADIIEAAALGENVPANGIAAVRRFEYPRDAEVLRRIALSKAHPLVRREALSRLPADQEKDTYLQAIEACEQAILNVHINKVTREQRAAVQLLQDLYRAAGLDRQLAHRHGSGVTAHQDRAEHADQVSSTHDDSYEDPFCGGWSDHTDETEEFYIDTQSHTDMEHDDYYMLK